MPPVRTYQGKKPYKKPSTRPVETGDDPFDQLFGPRRSPHPFSSSSEAIPTPSPGPSCESPEGRFMVFSNRRINDQWRPDTKCKKKIRKRKKPEFSLFKVDKELKKLLRNLESRKETAKQLGVPIDASTPMRRVHRKRTRGPDRDQSLCSHSKLLAANLSESKSASLLHPADVSAILNSPMFPLLRLPATPQVIRIPVRNSLDSITNKIMKMDLGGAKAPLDEISKPARLSEGDAEVQADDHIVSITEKIEPGLRRLSESDVVLREDGKSDVHDKTLPNAHASLLQADASSLFLGFSSIDETSMYQPSPRFVARRKPRVLASEAQRLTRSLWSGSTPTPNAVSTFGTSRCDKAKDSKGPESRLEELVKTPANSSSTAVDNSCTSDFIIRRRNLQRASVHVTGDSVVSYSGDSLVDPAGPSREDSGSGEISENPPNTGQLLPTRDAAVKEISELPSPEDRSAVDSSSESSLGGPSGGGPVLGISSEEITKRRRLLLSMDPSKRDSGDMPSPESSHSGVDSSNESALEEVGITFPKRLSRLKEGSSSGTSSDDFCVRDDLMSSSEDENDEEGCGNILSRPSDVALYQQYEPGSLEPLHENVERLDEEDENSSLSSESSAKKSPVDALESNRTPNMRRKANRHSEERSPTGRSSIGRASVIPELVSVIEEDSISSDSVTPLDQQPLEHFVLQPGKRYRRSLLIIQNVETDLETDVQKGRRYHENVEEVLRLQTSQCETVVEPPVQIIRKRISLRRSSWIKQNTPPPRRRLTLMPKMPDRSSVTMETPTPLSLPLRLTNQSLFGERTLPRPVHSPLSALRDSNVSGMESGKEAILRLCQQTQPGSFSDILPPESNEGCSKLGEGVYGEVFSVRRKDVTTVLKIIPVEGSRAVNDAAQKTYSEIAPELIIAKELHNLRFGASNGANKAGGFAEVVDIKLVRGCYPTQLLDYWDKFDSERGSYNERPDIFTETQQFIILEQANAGKELEEYNFSNANIALSLFKQVTYSLAVAESALSFEHRDLHWGNILISRTTDRKYTYFINSKEVSIPTHGVKGTIIDYTLSRITTSDGPLYNDLSKDPELFLGTGDFQFDVYRQMKKDVNNEWSQFQPKTNARWLFYVVDKLLKKKEYQRKSAKVHKDGLKVLRKIESWIETCSSALEVAERLAEL